jgi:hypothetical protein
MTQPSADELRGVSCCMHNGTMHTTANRLSCNSTLASCQGCQQVHMMHNAGGDAVSKAGQSTQEHARQWPWSCATHVYTPAATARLAEEQCEHGLGVTTPCWRYKLQPQHWHAVHSLLQTVESFDAATDSKAMFACRHKCVHVPRGSINALAAEGRLSTHPHLKPTR